MIPVFVYWCATGGLGEVLEHRGVPRERVVVAFAHAPLVEAFARRAIEGARDPKSRAERLYAAIVQLKRNGTIVADRDNTPKARFPRVAADLLEPESERGAGCYELSSLFVAAARSVGLAAVGVERRATRGTGQIGHIMAGLSVDGELLVFDLQNDRRVAAQKVRVLSDVELAAHHYNHLGVARFLRGDLVKALSAVDLALRLAPENPGFLNNRGTVLLQMGEAELGLAEVAHAVELEPHVPLYRYQLGRLYLATGELARAIESFGHAVELEPSYALAHRDLGWAMFLAGDRGQGQRSLERAARSADTPQAALYLGLFWLALGHADRAESVVAGAQRRGKKDASLRALRVIATGEATRDEAVVGEVERLRAVLAAVQAARKSSGTALPVP